MKKTILILFAMGLFLWASSAKAQQNERAQSVYFEALGPGIIYSLNYDTRFQSSQKGLGGRIGAGYIAIDGESLVTLPAMVNYLLGNNGRYFEIGLGATYFKGNDADDDIFVSDESGVIGTMIFGYRSQPLDGGFMFRAGFAPVFDDENFVPYYPYISLGYTF